MSCKLDLDKDTLLVSGKLDFSNARKISEQGRAMLKDIEKIKVDLSDLQQSDSSGLAVFIDWIRFAKSKQKDLLLIQVPQFIIDLGRVSGIDTILPIDNVRV